MIRSQFKVSSLFIGALFLLISAYSHASYNCDPAYQWTPQGSFLVKDVVRYKGLAYKAKRLSSNEQPGLPSTSSAWQYLGYCSPTIIVHCDFNGDNKLDSAKGFEYAGLVGALISSSSPKIPSVRENANMLGTGEVTVTYDDTFTNPSPNAKAADQVWNQNGLGMNPYAKRGAHFGYRLAAGDFNNDNFCDLAVSAPGFYSQGSITENYAEGLINILYGSPNGLRTIVLGENGRPINPFDAQRFSQDSPNVPGVTETGDAFGSSIATADFNGDGFDDVVIGVPNESVVLSQQQGEIKRAGFFNIIYGSKRGIQTTNPIPVGYFQPGSGNTDVEAGDQYGSTVAAADFDNDGYGDLAISAPYEDEGIGKISLFRGSSTGLDLSSKRDFNWHNLISDPDLAWGGIGGLWMGVSDFNNDGYFDLDIFAGDCEYEPNCHDNVFSIPGSATGLIIND